MNLFFICLFWRLMYSITSNTVKIENFVMELTIYSTPHKTIENVESRVACAILCSSNLHCCGLTMESSNGAIKCLLFNFQTSNNCRNTTGGVTNVQFIKQLTDCSELPTDTSSGVYRIYPSRQTAVFVYCEMTNAGGRWTVLQRRHDGSGDFYRYWAAYKTGFGDLETEFWLGNDIIHALASQKQYKVRFDLEDFDGFTAYAEYDIFHVDNEAMEYGLNISGYSGTAGTGYGLDSAETGVVPFSAIDVDNDKHPKSCANDIKKSGWWFEGCSIANINGMYKPRVSDQSTIHWRRWRDFQCLSKTRMMIKPS